MGAPYGTPTYVLRIRGLDTSLLRPRLKLTQGAASLKLKRDELTITRDGDVTDVAFTLSQEQSGMFGSGSTIEAQLNWVDSNDFRVPTSVGHIKLARQTDCEVIHYAEL